MPIKGKFFPSQTSEERVFLLVRRHWVVYAAMSLIFALLLLPIIVLIFFWVGDPIVFAGALGNFVIVFAGIYALMVLGLMLYGFVNYYLDVYIVTNKRIVDIKQNGFFKREIAELHLHQVQDVEARVEGVFQTLMHFGTIYIQTAGERENFVFEDVPHPYTLAKQIVELHEAQIESEYEPKMSTKNSVDDYRPEDYSGCESAIKKDEIKIDEFNKKAQETNEDLPESLTYDDLEKESVRTNIQEPVEEFGFGADEPKSQVKFEEELKELSEGEEVSIDDKSRSV